MVFLIIEKKGSEPTRRSLPRIYPIVLGKKTSAYTFHQNFIKDI